MPAVTDATPLRHSPLHDRHVALGAKLADFGGWEMPIEYPGGGVLAEHGAVRERVGVFDVSHLGKATVRGPGALEFVNRCLTNDVGRLTVGQAQYNLCCDDATGGVVDDLIAYVRADEVFLVPNAANTAEVVRRMAAAAPDGISVADAHEEYAVLAVQGPDAPRLVSALGLPTGHDYMSFAEAEWRGQPVLVCRSGYTGELGFELLPRWDAAGPLWDELLARGVEYGVLPCGLGSRDTLRTEMGYPLHGHELSLDISPLQARAGWAIAWAKPEFWGRDAVVAEKERGAPRLLWGLESQDRGIPRGHMTVRTDRGVVGEVTSGTFSPTRKVGIGLALLDRDIAEGSTVTVDIRGRESVMKVVKPPFVESHVR